MGYTPANEFDHSIFAERYEQLTDTFIDVEAAAISFAGWIHPISRVFEIGIGTGYFAQKLLDIGISVSGIQPQDELLKQLKRLRPTIQVVQEVRLENYVFDQLHDIIVFHSSVFLFSRHYVPFGTNGEVERKVVFQSFISEASIVYSNLLKVIRALQKGGRCFVNLQSNPLPDVTVGPSTDPFRFEMLSCEYDFDVERVRKVYRATHGGISTEICDLRYCTPLAYLRERLRQLGVDLSITSDDRWAILKPK